MPLSQKYSEITRNVYDQEVQRGVSPSIRVQKFHVNMNCSRCSKLNQSFESRWQSFENSSDVICEKNIKCRLSFNTTR